MRRKSRKAGRRFGIGRRRKVWRIAGLGIVCVLLLSASAVALGAQAASDPAIQPSSGPDESATPREVVPGTPVRELPGQRTATSKTFELSNGARETRLYQTPINYHDEKDGWQPIGQGFHEGNGTITNGPNKFDVTLPTDLSAAPLRFSVGEHWISERPTSLPTRPITLSSGVATYEASASGPGIQFSGLPNGVNEDIELPGPSAPSTYRFDLQASDGLAPTLTQAGSIEFTTAKGWTVAEIPAPVMYDSATVPQTSHAVHYVLEPAAPGHWTLVVEADPEWLARPGLDWPVEIDPTIVIPRDENDCNIFNGPLEESNTCGTTGFPYLGAYAKYKSSGADEYAHSLLRFQLHSIPAGASVYSATLGLYGYSHAHTAGVEGWAVTKPWDGNVNWTRASGQGGHHVAWTTKGGDYTLPNFGLSASGAPEKGWWLFTGSKVKSMVDKWLHGELDNDGFLLKLSDESLHECTPTCVERSAYFESSMVPEATRPYLSVSYYPPAPGSKLVAPMDGTTSAKRFKLQAGWTVPGFTGVFYQFQGPEGWETIPAKDVTTTAGASVSWPISVEEKGIISEPLYWNATGSLPAIGAELGQLHFRVRAILVAPGGLAGYTEPAQVTLNMGSGGPKDATAQVGPGTLDLITGNLSVGRTDVSIPGFGSGLEFTRSFNSQEQNAEEGGLLGPGWVPGFSMEEEGGSAWKGLAEETYVETWEEEECKALCTEAEEEAAEEESTWISVLKEQRYEYALLSTVGGEQVSFEKQGGSYITPPELTGWSLVSEEGGARVVLSEPGGVQTTFEKPEAGSGNYYVPKVISQPGGAGNKSQLVWAVKEGKKRMTMAIAPRAEGVTCLATGEKNAKETPGCHVLTFTYQGPSGWGGEAGKGERLTGITFWAATSPTTMGHWEVAHYAYSPSGRLVEEWDPRLATPLKETYTYNAGGHLQTIKPPGQEPWTLEYGKVPREAVDGRLVAVKRPSLLASPTTAQTTIAYEVPLSGAAAPYEMGPSTVAQWGEKNVPQDATAIFPPDQVPTASPPTTYSHATVYYMDVEGHLGNTVTPAGAGTSGASITTAESDQFGNVVRELTATNRNRVLAAPEAEREKVWAELETKRIFSPDGTEMLEEWGPTRQIRLESGTSTRGRPYAKIEYDQGLESGISPKPHLPTTETRGTLVGGTLGEQRVTTTTYEWKLRAPKEKVVDPGKTSEGHLNLVSKTTYDPNSGLPLTTSQPSNPEGGKAGTTKMVYYSATAGGECLSAIWANLPCRVEPAAQPGTVGLPNLLVTRFTKYNYLGEPMETLESPAAESANTRTTVSEYDSIGRPETDEVTGGGVGTPKTETLYSPTLGLPVKHQFVCGPECTPKPSYTSSFGSAGTGNGQFAEPGGDAIDASGDIWVADTENNRIEEFNPSGEYLFKFGSKGTGNGQFKRPSAVAIDASGNVWVTDSENDRVQEFNSKGEFIRKFGSLGAGNGQFAEPQALAFDSKGNLWVADTNNDRLEEFNSKGEFIKNVGSGLFNDAKGVAIAPGNKIFATSQLTDKVLEFNEAGEKIGEFGTAGSGEGQFEEPEALAVDSSGNIWVTDPINEFVDGFTQAGKSVGRFGKWGHGPGEFEFGYWDGITSDGNGGLFVVDTKNDRVQKWAVGSSNEATTTKYNALGQVVEYEDADGNATKMTYDVDGRPVTVSDGRGTQTYGYDTTSGLLTKLEDSGAGTFTAAYDADGNTTERVLPNGLTAKASFNEAGEPMKVAYTKTSSCGTSCTWFEESLERAASGQIVNSASTLVNDRYKYDKAGRLTEAQETPAESGCTTRSYEYDADSNRLSRTTREPGVGGVCATTGGATQKYKYDEADRLFGTGVTYDPWGRITALPAEFAGVKTLETTYFANNMVAMQKQNGVTNTFQLDATGRQRQREQTGGVTGVEVFHYDGPGGSVAWTALGSTWSRVVTGIGGEVAAIQDSGGTVTFDLTDMHGNVVASASSSPTATKLLATFRFDEFGEPVSGSAGRFGWLGGHARRTELPSGVIQMGARSYIPQLGRFLTPDPILGGSDNAYDYAGQDPINGFDLTGTKKKKKTTNGGGGGAAGKNAAKNVNDRHLLESHQIKATVTGGLLTVQFKYTAKERVEIHGYVNYKGKGGPIEHVTGANNNLIAANPYAAGATTGETCEICITATAVKSARSYTHCYTTVITAEKAPRPVPDPAPLPERESNPGIELPPTT